MRPPPPPPMAGRDQGGGLCLFVPPDGLFPPKIMDQPGPFHENVSLVTEPHLVLGRPRGAHCARRNSARGTWLICPASESCRSGRSVFGATPTRRGTRGGTGPGLVGPCPELGPGKAGQRPEDHAPRASLAPRRPCFPPSPSSCAPAPGSAARRCPSDPLPSLGQRPADGSPRRRFQLIHILIRWVISYNFTISSSKYSN